MASSAPPAIRCQDIWGFSCTRRVSAPTWRHHPHDQGHGPFGSTITADPAWPDPVLIDLWQSDTPMWALSDRQAQQCLTAHPDIAAWSGPQIAAVASGLTITHPAWAQILDHPGHAKAAEAIGRAMAQPSIPTNLVPLLARHCRPPVRLAVARQLIDPAVGQAMISDADPRVRATLIRAPWADDPSAQAALAARIGRETDPGVLVELVVRYHRTLDAEKIAQVYHEDAQSNGRLVRALISCPACPPAVLDHMVRRGWADPDVVPAAIRHPNCPPETIEYNAQRHGGVAAWMVRLGRPEPLAAALSSSLCNHSDPRVAAAAHLRA